VTGAPWRAALAATLILGGGCASSSAFGPRGAGAPPAGERVWVALLAGDLAGADRELAGGPDDGKPEAGRRVLPPASAFADLLLAHARGEDQRALRAALDLIEAAGRSRRDALTGRMAGAAAALLDELLQAALAPRAFEDRLLSLPTENLDWPARLAVEGATDGVARRRGDGRLLAAAQRRGGCLTVVTLQGAVGRLPHLDLAAALPAQAAAPRPLELSGCRLLIDPQEGVSTVRVLEAVVAAPPAGGRLIVDFGGPALVRFDGGDWRTHTSLHRHGPRWSAFDLPPGPGPRKIEVRLGSWGGPSELRLFVLADGGHRRIRPAPVVAGVELAVGEVADALLGELTGEVDQALEAAARLRARRRFALGMSIAARVTARDPTRPQALVRDEAQSLYRQAVTLDPTLARVWGELSRMELGRDRPAEAVELGETALRARPRFWPAAVTLLEALRGRGFEKQADEVLNGTLASLGEGPAGEGACPLLQAALERAQARHQVVDEEKLAGRLQRCDAQSAAGAEWLRRRGDLRALASTLERQLPTARDRLALRADLANVRLGLGDPPAAIAELRDLVSRQPREPTLRVRLADALTVAGQRASAQTILADTVRFFPARDSLRQIARIAGQPLPVDAFRLDGRAVIRQYRQQGREDKAPAVLVLDRTVVRVLPDGTQVILTHNIVNVKTKDGIARWGEVQVPEGAEILALRTHKANGSIHEAEEIAGKQSISAPDLAASDFVEWETLEYREPAEGFSPGFLADRFFFQSVELPLARSELLLLAPSGLAIDADLRAGAPAAEVSPGPEPGTVLQRYVMNDMPQLFRERAAENHVEWIPSVRLSSGVTMSRWMRLIEEQLFGVTRGSPALRDAARLIGEQARRTGTPIAQAVVSWVNQNVEPEAIPLEPATVTLARGRGNRGALMVALARTLGVPAQLALVRPLMVAPAEAAALPQELDDFHETLVRFPGASTGQPPQYVDARLEHAPFGYLSPGLDGAPCLVIGGGAAPSATERARSASPDGRVVTLTVKLDGDGAATGTVIEELRGAPAIEWASALERAGDDERKLRQDFEQRWLGHHFPGSRLEGLAIDVDRARPGQVRLRYGFSHPHLAVRDGDQLKLLPTFFRSQPGRRFAVESRRRATLVMGADAPIDLTARIELPPGARVLEAGAEGEVSLRLGSEQSPVTLRLAERREIAPDGAAVVISRQSRLPLTRIEPARYPAAAPELRRMDRLEQGEIRVAVPKAKRESGRP
jgi:tetratricopeptide (TPR) repeat protein